jgi:hypothetical protein
MSERTHENELGVSDPLPPSAAVPLLKGDNVFFPLQRGEPPQAAGSRSHPFVHT